MKVRYSVNDQWLEEAYLSHNQLIALPESFRHLDSLRKLYIDHNQLTSLPDSFGYLRSLQVCDLSSNQLTTLPRSFRFLQTLTTLLLVKNPWEGELGEFILDYSNAYGKFLDIPTSLNIYTNDFVSFFNPLISTPLSPGMKRNY